MAESRVSVPGYGRLGEVGRGGFGVVYRAEQSDVHRIVAIKVLSGFDEAARRRFDRERDAMGLLSSHPNIVTIYASGFAGESPYLVMEYLDRGSLADQLARGPVPWRDATAIAVKLAGALQAAHEAGILHRDVKPENVLVSSYDEPKLADFGIARLEEGPDTHSGVFTASLHHAAPEVLAGKRPTYASDVYSLASTLFALLAGHAPFQRETDESIVPLFARAATEPVPNLRGHGIPDAVCSVVESGLAKLPEDRPASAAEFGEQLQRVQRELGLEATPMVIPSTAPIVGDASATPRKRSDVSTNIVDSVPPLPDLDRVEHDTRTKRRRRVGLLAAGSALIFAAAIGGAVVLLDASDPGESDPKALLKCRSETWRVDEENHPLPNLPRADVRPCLNLHHKQEVHVRVEGFDNQETLYVRECFYVGGKNGSDQVAGVRGGYCEAPRPQKPKIGENGVVVVKLNGSAEQDFKVKDCDRVKPAVQVGPGQCALVISNDHDEIGPVTADPVFLTFLAEPKK